MRTTRKYRVGDRVPGWEIDLPEGEGRELYWTVFKIEGNTVHAARCECREVVFEQKSEGESNEVSV